MVILLLAVLTVVSAAKLTVNCPVPISPQNGQAFLYQEGQTVKYVCEPGYVLHGNDIVRCADGQWEHQPPFCISLDAGVDTSENPDMNSIPFPPSLIPPARPLFEWGGEEPEPETELEPEPEPETEPVPELDEVDTNTTNDDETPLSDEARMQLLLYPRRRVVTRRIRPARIQRGTELEDEQKRRANRADASSTTIHLQAPPSMIYVRRTQSSGKSDQKSQVRRMAPLHMTVATNDQDKVEVLSTGRAAVETQGDKGQQTDEALRQMYWWAHEYYPRQSQLVEYYRQGGSPVAMTVSESQLAWIHSLHPELRDQYLRDIYGIRATDAEASARAQAYYYGYRDPYYYYHSPLHYREPMSLIVEEPITSYDYSCHQAHSTFVKAPKLPNAHIARYDRRQNQNSPHNHYLSAVYRCDPGYVMYDTRYTELHCSQRRWIGPQPVCVPARG